MKHLCDRLAQELMVMQHMIQQSQPFLDQLAQPQDPSYQAAFVGALALNLHSFYTGAERIFEAIAQQIDQYQPTGSQWHRQLLDQMVVTIPDIRPAVISGETHLLLDELRRFRHVVRSVYAYQLDPERVLDLAKRVFAEFSRFAQEINAFCQTLTP